MKLAPIALFAYNRPTHLRRTLEALCGNELAKESDLYIFSDGPKSLHDAPMVEAVRDSLKNITGFQSVTVIEQPANLGLANSIIQGVTNLCHRHGRTIVLEDDMVTSQWFLRFMNDGLATYELDPEVISIHGYLWPVTGIFPETFFLRGADCWGWATWDRGWKHFNPDGAILLSELERRNLTHAFDFDGAYSYTAMLRDQIAGRNNSWAIRWHASAFLLDKLTLYPGRSLIQNIGLDNSGTHCVVTDEFAALPSAHAVPIHRQSLKENRKARRQISEHLRGGPRMARKNWWKRLFSNTTTTTA